jgi:hypothetical protein
MKSYRVLVIFAILFFSVNMAFANEYTADVSLSLSEEYNDNIFLAHSERESDFVTYISPGIDFSLRSPNSELKLGYSPTFSYYSSYNELNSTAHRFSANGVLTLSKRLSFTITDTFVKSSEIRDIRAIPDLGPITGRIERTLHTIGSGISYSLRDNLSCILNASYSDVDYKEPGLNEVKTYSGNIGLNYRRSERTTLSANVRYVKYAYDLSSDAAGQDYTLGITYTLTPTLTIGVTGGAKITKIDETGESATDFSGGADLTKRFERGVAALSYRQAVIAGIETGAPLRTRTVSLRLTRPVTNQLTTSISALYSNFESVETTGVDWDEIGFNTDLTYNFSPGASLALSYNYVDTNNKIVGTRDYYNHIIFLTLRVSYSRKL